MGSLLRRVDDNARSAYITHDSFLPFEEAHCDDDYYEYHDAGSGSCYRNDQACNKHGKCMRGTWKGHKFERSDSCFVCLHVKQ